MDQHTWVEYLLKHAYWRTGNEVTMTTRDTTRLFGVQLPCRKVDDDGLLALSLLTMISPKLSVGYKSNSTPDKNFVIYMVNAANHDDITTTIEKTKTNTWFSTIWDMIGMRLIVYRFLRQSVFNDKVLTIKEIATIESNPELLEYLFNQMTELFVTPINRYLLNKSKYTSTPLTGVNYELEYLNMDHVSDEAWRALEPAGKAKLIDAQRTKLHEILNNHMRLRMDTIMHMVLLNILNSTEFEDKLAAS